jgi:amidase
MKRRSFLSSTVVAAFGLPVLSLDPIKPGESFEINRRDDKFELSEANIDILQQYMSSNKYTSRKITELYLERIKNLDKKGPTVNSVIEINPDSLTIADAMDKERRSGKVRGPMHGIPILIKDNIDTADKMSTSAGSLALAGSIALKDAFIVSRLREAGAVLLGKTNLSEWANIRSSHSSSGWSGRGGQTHNPFVLDRNPCGSSSGSGAAVSSNFCAIAIGTETDGSIVCPASMNGVVGIKPTLGLWSRSGIIPISHSQDTAGPMARNVKDAAILLGLLAGTDPLDEATKSSSQKAEHDYTKFLKLDGLKSARIGVARSYFGFHPKVDELMEKAIRIMKENGAEIIDPAEIKTWREIGKPEFEVLLFELKADLNKYLTGLRPEIKMKSLKDLIAFNEANKEKEMPWFGQETFIEAEAKGPLTDKAYLDALASSKKAAGEDGIDTTFREHKLDAIMAPTMGPAYTTDWLNGDHITGDSSTPAAVAGYPAITLPAGFINELPIGLTFMGTAWSEASLIRIAYAYEQLTKHRKAPKFIDSIR